MSPTSRTSVTARHDDGPVRAQCEVVSRRREGEYLTITLAAPEIAERTRPGHFVNVAVQAPGTILRRPFSVYRVSRQGMTAGTIEFVFDAHGPGTQWLANISSHDVLDVLGPLGSPFPLPQQKVSCLLVAGGYGAAPLFMLAEELTRMGLRVDMIAGASTRARLFNTIEAKRMTASVTFTTEDGSFGTEGRVSDVFERVVEDSGAGVVYACGPMPMLRAISEQSRELSLPCQVAVEEHMACGVGVCWTCVLPMTTRNGEVRMKRSCIDGPVFNGARVAWDHSRWQPPPIDATEPDPEPEPVRYTDDQVWGA